MVNARLLLKALSVGYKEAVQSGINLSVFPHDFVVLIGPNGTGKSTLLKTLSGFIKPLEGSVELNGKTIDSLGREEFSREVAVVLTQAVNHPFLSVEELVGFGRYPHHKTSSKAKDEKVVNHSIEVCGITHLRNKTVGEISDGEKQRVMIARALAQETPVILLDEPTAHLDIKAKAEIFLLLKQLCNQEGKSIIMATHEVTLGLETADKVWFLPQKNTHVADIPENIIESETLVNHFSSEKLLFDKNSLSVKLCFPSIGHVTFSGNDEALQAKLKVAFRRMGVEIKANATTLVLANEGTVEVNGQSFSRVSEALDFLKSCLMVEEKSK